MSEQLYSSPPSHAYPTANEEVVADELDVYVREFNVRGKRSVVPQILRRAAVYDVYSICTVYLHRAVWWRRMLCVVLHPMILHAVYPV